MTEYNLFKLGERSMKLIVCDFDYLSNNPNELKGIIKDPEIKLVIYYQKQNEVAIKNFLSKETADKYNGMICTQLSQKVFTTIKKDVENIALNHECDPKQTEYKIALLELADQLKVKQDKNKENKPYNGKDEEKDNNKSSYGTFSSSINGDVPSENLTKEMAEVYNKLSKIFPSSFTQKDVVLIIIALAFSVPSVQPNFSYGAGFAKDIFEDLKKHGIALSEEDIDNFRIYFAIISAVVNGCINTLTLKGVGEFVINTCGKINDEKSIKNKILIVFSLIGVITLATGASFPNIEFVMDTLKSATQSELISMEIIQGFINTAMNVRGFFGAKDFFTQIFGKEDQNAAMEIRKRKLKMLNELLPKSKRLSDEKINILASGTVYEDKYDPRWRKYTSLLAAIVPTGIYDVAYLVSAWQAATTLANRWFAGSDLENSPADLGVGVFSVLITFVSYNLKWAFLGKANWLAVQRLFDKLFSELILQPNSSEIKTSKLWKGLSIAKEIFFVAMGGQSMTGADGLVLSKIFNDKETFGNFGWAILISLLGAGGINYKDTIDFFERGQTAITEIFYQYLKKLPEFNASIYGNTPEKFIIGLMYYIALTSDAVTLQDADKIKKGGDEENPLLNKEDSIRYKDPKTGEDRTTHKLNEKFKEFDGLVEKLKNSDLPQQAFYEEFLRIGGRAKPNTNLNTQKVASKNNNNNMKHNSFFSQEQKSQTPPPQYQGKNSVQEEIELPNSPLSETPSDESSEDSVNSVNFKTVSEERTLTIK